MWRSCGVQPSHKERAIGVVRCEKEGLLLQPLRWCCVDCVIHHERDVREEQKYIYVARTSNNGVISSGDLYCCLLPRCEALRICRSGFPIATISCDLQSRAAYTLFRCFIERYRSVWFNYRPASHSTFSGPRKHSGKICKCAIGWKVCEVTFVSLNCLRWIKCICTRTMNRTFSVYHFYLIYSFYNQIRISTDLPWIKAG